MTKPDVLVMATNTANLVPWLEADYSLHRYDLSEDPDTLLDEVGERITAVVTTGAKGFSEAQLDKLPQVGIVACSGVGYDPIDVEACSSRGVVVTNTPDVLTDDVADLAIGLMISSRRNMIVGDAHVRSGDWGRKGMMGLTSSLKGKRLGIVGLGRIGSAIARRSEPMGLVVGYCTRTKRDNAYHYDPDVEALAAWSEILIVSIPGTPETERVIDREVIEAVGPDGTLINISRGSVVDEPALISALQSGALGSAALDVYLNEPNPNPAFRELENVVLYPHHASGTVETRNAMARLVVDNLAAYFAGKPPITPVNSVLANAAAVAPS
jgi:lactate dehydrogenase-like 2-hydroxyacid dehydrogenase